MAASAGSGDAWRVSGEDRAKHDSQFFSLKPVNGYITGEQARGFFMQSGLPTPVLGQIWGLADMNNDGKMDKKEFSIAMHLIKKKLQGYELPKSLPPQLKADPSPVIGSFGTMPNQPGMMGMGPNPGMGMPPTSMAMGPRMPMMANGMPPMGPQSGFMGANTMPMQPGGFAGGVPVRQGTPPAGGGGLAIPHPSKLKYTQLFNSHDRNKRGSLTGVEARSILMHTGVPQQLLAQIWNLSDVDKDGKLDCDEFCIAMHLTDLVKMGQVLPAKLPPELALKGHSGGGFGAAPQMAAPAQVQPKDSFGDLLGNMGMPPPVQPVANGDSKVEEPQDQSPVTFEDKRKQNFDKGQAELERRRQQLQEQMRKENEERMEKERKEQEKREKQRQEQEMKRQQELEKQLEKQRAIEREKEEHRRKMMEQREAARRELERQRQMEWERQRKEQLMVEKAREYEQLSALKSQSSNLKGELELLQGKKSEINGKISQVKNGVTDFTAHIEAMRSTRDLKNNDIERLQKELQELNQKLHMVQSEKQNLDLRVQTSIQSNPMSETHRTMMHSVELKKTSVQKLKKDLEQLEKDTEIRLGEIDVFNTQLKELNDSVASVQGDISKTEKQNKEQARQQGEEEAKQKKDKEKQDKLRKDLEAQRKREETVAKPSTAATETPKNADTSEGNWFAFGGEAQTSAASSDNWASVFDQSGGSQQASSIDWGAGFSSQKTTATGSNTKTFKLSGSKQKYQALYQFDARNEDELTLNVGDTVWVFVNQTGAEPGWKGGEMNGVCGWFPEAYVEKVADDSSQAGFGVPAVTTDTASAGGLMSSEDSSFMTVPVKVPTVSPTPGQGQVAPDGLQAQALYPWKAKKENHLTFNKGDIISVREQQDMWWSGELYGKVGWFPKSYVKLISGPSAVTSQTGSLGTESPITNITPATNGAMSPPADSTATAGETYIAMYTYQSNEPGDLTFNQGEIIVVTKKDGDWWTGTTSGRSGIFPANYVKLQEQQPQPKSPAQPTDLSGQSTSPASTTDSTATTDTAAVSEASQPGLSTDTPPVSSGSPNPDPSDTKTKVHSPFCQDPFNNELSQSSSSLGGGFNEDPFSKVTNQSESSLGVGFNGDPFSNGTNQSGSSLGGGFNEDPFRSEPNQNDVSFGGVFTSDPFGNDVSNKDTPVSNAVATTDLSSGLGETKCEVNKGDNSIGIGDFTMDPFQNVTDTQTPALGQSDDPFKAFGDLGFKSETEGNFSKDQFQMPKPSQESSIDKQQNHDILEETNKSQINNDPLNNLAGLDCLANDLLGDINNVNSSNVSSNIAEQQSDEIPTQLSINQSQETVAVDKLDPFAEVTETTESQLIKKEASPDFSNFEDPFTSNTGLSSDPFADLGGGDPFKELGFSFEVDTPTDNSFHESKPSSEAVVTSMANLVCDSPTTLVQSVENDASSCKSPTLDLGPSPTPSLGNCDESIQTSGSVTCLNTLNIPLTSPSTEIPPTMDLVSDPGPPPIPTKRLRKKGLNKPGLDKQGPADSPSDIKSVPDQSAGEATDTRQDKQVLKPAPAPGGGSGTLKKPEIATVIAPYTATGEEQLSLNPGQLIQVRKKSPSGWWEGELQARGQKRKIGWFPANYVKLLQASARNTPDNTLGSSGTSSPANALSGARSAEPSPAPQPTTSPPSSQSYVDHVIALYPYTAQNPDELTFQKDAVINVIKKDDPDWWSGELNGQTGMFPSNYVQSPTPESTSWSNDPQVLALTSKEEGKRQVYIHELINTEETYMADMSIVLDAFYKPMRDGGGLNDEQLEKIFVNWKDLIVCNTKLQKALRVRKKMCGVGQVINSIGDILCENIPHLTPYIRFCSCQLNAAALLQKISENHPKFQEIHKKCVQNPKTKGMPLSSFLLKPMQRITKYPLIVEKILKHTPESHPDHTHLLEALERCQELCNQVNEGVREKENSDRLEWIQQHVHCEGLPEKITFNSVTNCLGPRKLLHTGVVYKSKSNKELAAFLFNDFLLLTTSNRPLNSTTHSLFDNTGHVQYKMYKSPIFLNEVMIKKPASEDTESFTVSHIDRVYNLKCHNQNERDTWVRRLDTASRNYLDTERKKREKAISLRRTPGVGRLLVVIIEGKDLQASDDNDHFTVTSWLPEILLSVMGKQRTRTPPVEVLVLYSPITYTVDPGKSDPYCEVSMGAQEHKTKVINNTLNPKWNASMQFIIRDVDMDALCITVFDRDLFSPNDFLGRTEIRIMDILTEANTQGRGPITKRLLLHEVPTGEVVVKLDLQLYEQT